MPLVDRHNHLLFQPLIYQVAAERAGHHGPFGARPGYSPVIERRW
jgi:hypothetical protein